MNKYINRNDAMLLTGLSRGQMEYLSHKNLIRPARPYIGYSMNQIMWLGIFKAFLDKGLSHKSITKIFEQLFGNVDRFEDITLFDYAVLEVSSGTVTLAEMDTVIIQKFDGLLNLLASQNIIQKDDKIIGNVAEFPNYIEINGQLFILIYRIFQQIMEGLEILEKSKSEIISA